MGDEPKCGRPSVYTEAIIEEILARLTAGESLRQICRSEGMPAEGTVRAWVAEDRGGVSARYARARESGWLAMAEEILDIADDGTNDWQERELESGRVVELPDHEHIQRSRLRVDTRKWLLSKMLPKQFGDKVSLGGEDGGPLRVVVRRLTDDA